MSTNCYCCPNSFECEREHTMNAGYVAILLAADRAMLELKETDFHITVAFNRAVAELEVEKDPKHLAVSFERFEKAFQSCMYTSGRGETI